MISKFTAAVLLMFFFFNASIAQTLTGIESVEYDPTQNRWFISNGGNIMVQESDGTRSVFGEGAASFGMEVMGDNLYVISGVDINGYNLETGDEVMSLSIPGASFLNGMTSDGNGKLYATDFSTRKIHMIDVSNTEVPNQEVIVSNTEQTPNGIVYDEDRNQLIYVTWTSNAPIRAVSLEDFSLSTLVTTPSGNIDGIDEDNEGNYYISTWNPSQIVKYNNDFSTSEVVSTPQLTNPADICYAKEINTLGIPHYPNNGNEVVLIDFGGGTATKNIEILTELNISPNPYSSDSKLSLSLLSKANVEINIYSVEGKIIGPVYKGELSAGEQLISIPEMNLSTGIYYLVLDIGAARVTKKLMVK